jgi:8-oxo-dGTP diphosphatase
MPRAGVAMVVLDAGRRRVLLHRREDFRLWSLPGGRVEPGEAPERAATRGVHEETGYHVAVERPVGEYWRPQTAGGETKYVYRGRVVGGAPIARGPETIGVRWFPVTALPPHFPRFMRNYLADALADSPAVVRRTERLPTWEVLLRRVLFWLRDRRNRLRGQP